MKTTNKAKWLGAALLAAMAMTAARASAATSPSYLNINVTISNNLSVTVDTLQTSSQTVSWSGAATLVAAATATVVNDSGYISERWSLSTTASSFDPATGAAGWTIAGAAAADQVALQAVFGPAGVAAGVCSGAIWSNGTSAPVLSTSQTQYTQTVLADTLTSAGAYQPDMVASNRVSAGTTRALCWKLAMPTSTSITGTQVVPVVVTAF